MAAVVKRITPIHNRITHIANTPFPDGRRKDFVHMIRGGERISATMQVW